MWVFPKIVGFPPNHPFFHRVFPYFHHPLWGPTTIFGNTHIYPPRKKLTWHRTAPENMPLWKRRFRTWGFRIIFRSGTKMFFVEVRFTRWKHTFGRSRYSCHFRHLVQPWAHQQVSFIQNPAGNSEPSLFPLESDGFNNKLCEFHWRVCAHWKTQGDFRRTDNSFHDPL